MGFYNLWHGEVKQWMTWRKMEIKIKDWEIEEFHSIFCG
jgi:hypothetical protein